MVSAVEMGPGGFAFLLTLLFLYSFIAKKPDAQPAPPTTGQLQGDQALFTVDASSLEAQAAAPARKARSKPRATNKQSNVTDKYPNIVAPPVFKGGADDFLRQSPLSAPQLYWHILQLSTTLIATIGAYMSLDAIIFDLRSFNLPYYTYGIHLHATAFMLFDLCYHLHCAKDALQDKERIEVYAKEACFMKLWEGTEKMVRIVYDCVPPDGKQVGPQDRDRIRTCWEECTILRDGNGKKNSVGWSKCWDLPK